MAKLVKLHIKNFRGIQNHEIHFNNENLICFIGRGDSGKTTVLDAISNVLSPSWNLVFHDTDFYNCQYENQIEIEASLVDIPEKLLSDDKYGLYIQTYNTDNHTISENVIAEEAADNIKPVLTIKLVVDRSLEPKWTVTNSRGQDEKEIRSADRAMLNCFMVSDYVDKHFSWNRGNPLYSLLKGSDLDPTSDKNIVIDSLRQAKIKIDEHPFLELGEITDLIKAQAASLGLNISNAHTTLDFRELSIKDGRISLHEDSIPFRLKGKGSKRLASFAIQSALVSNGGIMLVDEIEQGLEPDRVKQLVRTLREQSSGQIFLTTHSREVLTELGAKNVLLFLKDGGGPKLETKLLSLENEGLQKAIRGCPEAFFAKKVIVCEGATEIGICRALDKWRTSQEKAPMSFKDCAYVDGTGSTLVERTERITEHGFITALFCDSDCDVVNGKKQKLIAAGTSVFDCELKYCIEQQVFSSLPWSGIQELIKYVLMRRKNNNPEALKSAIESKLIPPAKLPANWQDIDNPEIRAALAAASIVDGKEWFKTIEHGEALGEIIFKYLNQMGAEGHLRKMFENLSGWVDT